MSLTAQPINQHLTEPGHIPLANLSRTPAALWLEYSAQTGRLLSTACAIAGETHKALFRSTEAQIRLLGDIAVSSIAPLNRNAPRAPDIARKSVHSAPKTAEQSAPNSEQIAATLPEKTSQKPKAPARSRSRAKQSTS